LLFDDEIPDLNPGQYQLGFDDTFAVDSVDFADTWTFNLSGVVWKGCSQQ
jgi:hypothetical protein